MNLLFDLDGTLTDPLVGITKCLQYATSKLGGAPRTTSELARFIGPPLRPTFAELLSSDDQDLISRAIVLYRERFTATGMFENEVYRDVVAGLEELAAEGHRLWVVTSKPQVYAQKIIEHFGLLSHFTAIYGSELDGRNGEKEDLIRVVLDNERLEPGETWMIGDRARDLRGGRANGVRTVGVLWGYGSEEELQAESPDLLVHDMSDLVAHFRRDSKAAGQNG